MPKFNFNSRVTQDAFDALKPYLRVGDSVWGRGVNLTPDEHTRWEALNLPDYEAFQAQWSWPANKPVPPYLYVQFDYERNDDGERTLREMKAVRAQLDAEAKAHAKTGTRDYRIKIGFFAHLNQLDLRLSDGRTVCQAVAEIVDHLDFGKSQLQCVDFPAPRPQYKQLDLRPYVTIAEPYTRVMPVISSTSKAPNLAVDIACMANKIIAAKPGGLGCVAGFSFYFDASTGTDPNLGYFALVNALKLLGRKPLPSSRYK